METWTCHFHGLVPSFYKLWWNASKGHERVEECYTSIPLCQGPLYNSCHRTSPPGLVPPADITLYTSLNDPKASPTWFEAIISATSKYFLLAHPHFSLEWFAMFHWLTKYSLHFLNEYSTIPETGTARMPLKTLLNDSKEFMVMIPYLRPPPSNARAHLSL
jgi:hypothetical protein